MVVVGRVAATRLSFFSREVLKRRPTTTGVLPVTPSPDLSSAVASIPTIGLLPVLHYYTLSRSSTCDGWNFSSFFFIFRQESLLTCWWIVEPSWLVCCSWSSAGDPARWCPVPRGRRATGASLHPALWRRPAESCQRSETAWGKPAILRLIWTAACQALPDTATQCACWESTKKLVRKMKNDGDCGEIEDRIWNGRCKNDRDSVTEWESEEFLRVEEPFTVLKVDYEG